MQTNVSQKNHYIFTGNFGSGKTEVAENFAMKLKEEMKLQ